MSSVHRFCPVIARILLCGEAIFTKGQVPINKKIGRVGGVYPPNPSDEKTSASDEHEVVAHVHQINQYLLE